MYYRYFISLELYSFGKNYKAQLASNELPKKKKNKKLVINKFMD